jgi:methyl-accepting chemotaxis protein
MVMTRDQEAGEGKRLGEKAPALVTAALLLGVIVSAAGLVWKARNDALVEWEQQLGKQSLMLAAHTHQTIKTVDLVLAGICDNIRSTLGEEDLPTALGSIRLHQELRDRLKGLPQAASAAIVGLDGRFLSQAAQFPASGISIADRDFIQAHVADPALDVYLSVPVQSRITGRWTIFVARKVRDRLGRPRAVAIAGLEVDFFETFYANIRNGDESVIRLFRSDGFILVSSPREEGLVGRNVLEASAALKQLSGGVTFASTLATGPHLADPSDRSMRMITARRLTDYPVVVSINVPDSMLFAKWRETVRVVGASVCGIVILIVSTSFWMAAARRRQRETSTSLRDAERVAAEQLQEIQARKRHEATLLREAETRSQVVAFDRQLGQAVQRIGTSVAQMAHQSERLAGVSSKALEGSDAAARFAARAASYVDSIATRAEHMSESAGVISAHAASSADALDDIFREADLSLDAVVSLASATVEIDAVSALIRNVASQTNLLALNATIEAARAGESGRGFAVVASEIKSLASQTTGATVEIARQIEAIQTAGRRCASALEVIHQRLAEARVIMEGIATKAGDQTRSTFEIARTIRAAAEEAASVSGSSSEVSTAAQFSNASVVDVLSSARQLNDEVKRIQEQIGTFSEVFAHDLLPAPGEPGLATPGPADRRAAP